MQKLMKLQHDFLIGAGRVGRKIQKSFIYSLKGFLSVWW